MKTKIFIPLCGAVLATFFNANAQLVYQKKIYELPTPRFSNLYSVEKGVDSGYILSGYSNTTSNLAGFIFIAKIDELGDTVWTRRCDGPEYEYGYIQNLYDSSYVLYGGLYSFNPCDQEDMFLMKLKANGDTLWTKHYSTCYGDLPRELVKGPNNGYYLFGSLNSSVSSSFGSTLLRLDSQGDTIWTRLLDIGGYNKQQNYACVATGDGGVMLSGYKYDSSAGSHSSFLIKMDSTGNMQWDNYFDAPYVNEIYQINPLTDGYLMLGRCYLGGALGYGTMFMKTDFNGNPTWGKMYDSISIFPLGSEIIKDNSIFYAGVKQRGPVIPGQFNFDLVSFKTDSSGNLLWGKKYVTNQLGMATQGLLQTNDNGYLIAANSTTDPTYNTFNGLLVKVDSVGNGCSDSVLAINVVDITSMIITSDTINPVIGYYPVTVGRAPFNYYGAGINYTDQCYGYVGIEEEKNIKENELLIYPNPSKSKIIIEFEVSKQERNSITITNIIGQTIKTIANDQFSIGKNIMEIDVSDLSTGLYFIQLYGDKKLLCRKFIKE